MPRLMACAWLVVGLFAPGFLCCGRAMADDSLSVSNPARAASDSTSGATINGDAAIFDPATTSSTNASSTNASSADGAKDGAPQTASSDAMSNDADKNAAAPGDDRIIFGDGVPGDGTLDGVTAAQAHANTMQAAQEQHEAENRDAKLEAAHRLEEKKRRAIEKQARIESEMRKMMNRLGCDEAEVQDAIISYIAAETRARRPLRDQSRRLFQALRASDAVAAPDLESLLNDFRIALDQDKTRHQIGEAALDQKINFKGNPRLEAMLLLFGVIGDGPAFFPTRESAPQPQIQSDEKRRPTSAPSTSSSTPNAAPQSSALDATATYPARADGTTPTP